MADTEGERQKDRESQQQTQKGKSDVTWKNKNIKVYYSHLFKDKRAFASHMLNEFS